MMRRSVLISAGLLFALGTMIVGCGDEPQQAEEAQATGAVHQATADVKTGISGMTIEQENIKHRLENDNKPGSFKYLYLISPFTGDVIFSSGVKGKVTSSGKRLKAATEARRFDMGIAERDTVYLEEQMGDDGSYGSSSEYLYWWDLKGVYRQIAPGACSVLISDQPIRTKKTVLNLDKAE